MKMVKKGNYEEHGKTFESELKLLTLRAHLRGKAEAFAEVDSLIGRILTPGMGEMVRNQGEWAGDQVQSVRRITARSRIRRNALADVEMDGHPRVYKSRGPNKRAGKKKAHPLKGKKLTWWYKLSKAEKAAIVAKRVANNKKTREEKGQAA
jgi:hypothetical protein